MTAARQLTHNLAVVMPINDATLTELRDLLRDRPGYLERIEVHDADDIHPEPRDPTTPPGDLGWLLRVPVVVDDTLAPNMLRLVVRRPPKP